MKKSCLRGFALSLVVMIVLSFSGRALAESITINGAGASFPFPVYSQWANKYASLTETKLGSG